MYLLIVRGHEPPTQRNAAVTAPPLPA